METGERMNYKDVARLLGEGADTKLEILHGLRGMPYSERNVKTLAKALRLSPTTVRVYLNDMQKNKIVTALDRTLSGRDKIWALKIDPKTVELFYRYKKGELQRFADEGVQ